MSVLVPLTDGKQVRLQPLDGVSERPLLRLIGGPVAAGVIGRGVALGAVGEELDQRRAAIRACTLGSPFYRGIDGEGVIAVDAKARDPVADRTLREGRA